MTWSSHDLPKIVTTGVSAATSSRRFGSSVGPVRAMAGRAERRQPRGLPAHRPGRGEELDVLGVGARPAALDVGHAVLVEHPGDAQLVGERERDVLALGAVAQRRVVEDDRAGRAVGHAGTPRLERPRSTAVASSVVPTTTSPSSRVRRVGQVRGPPAVVERLAARPPRSPPPTSAPAERPAQQHRGRQDRPDRVRAVLARDVRRRAVDRLVQPERAVLGPPLARATPTAASRGCRRAPPPRRTGCRRTGSR